VRRLLFSPGFPPMVGGQQNFMLARCVAAPEGLTVVAADCEDSREFDARQSFEIHRFAYPWLSPRFGPLRRALQLQRTAHILSRFLARRRYDVVELATVLPGGIVAHKPFRRRDFYLISYALGEDIEQPPKRWYVAPVFRRTLKRVDLFVAISQYTKGILMEMGVPPERIVIIHPPIDRDRFSRAGNGSMIRADLPPHDLILLTICRLEKKKGIDRIIELMPRLMKQFPGLLYVVGGEGEDLPRLQMLAARCGVSDRVVFLGRIPGDQLADVYAAGHVFVMPTRRRPKYGESEGFGIVFLEAGSQGLPVIGSSQGGCADAITDGVTGYLVDPNDLNEIESRVSELLSNPDLRRKLGEAGRRRAFEPTDWSPLLEAPSSTV
jgi:phosphatidylinositol alpha-1,6-mannosyltransferase